MEENSNSIYELITKLCENFATRLNGSQHKNVKRLRRKCYEILLSKCEKQIEPQKACLDENADPFCHLLTWEFELVTKHNLKNYADKLHQCAKRLEGFYSSDNKTFNGILYLLLQLRKVPDGDDSIMDKNVRSACRVQSHILQPFSNSMFSILNENTFKLPSAISCCDMKYSNDSFLLKPIKSKTKRLLPIDSRSSSVCVLYKQKITNFFEFPNENTDAVLCDEGYNSLTKSQAAADIWEIASKAELIDNRTWESFGKAFPEKELRFLSELGENANLWTDYVVALKNTLSLEEMVTAKIKIQEQQVFIKDVKYMLVGIVSKTFSLNGNEDFVLKSGISLKYYTPTAVKQYIQDLTFCGSCYRALNVFITSNEYKKRGYIFAELCESIKRYLAFYRFVVFSLPDGISLLALHNRMRKLKEQLNVLVSLCKIGPYRNQKIIKDIPCGVKLLNYIYKRVLNVTNQNILMILYSVFYPCCQVYFSRYLQQWILEGTLNDPYDEFFVKINLKYVATRGRTFWTRSYFIQEENIPDFISDIKKEILICGKAMNLLKMCVPSSPLQLYLMSKRTSLFTCCFTPEQLINLEQNTARYNLEAAASCSPLFCLLDKIVEIHAEDPAFLELVAKKRLETLKRLELERLKKLEEAMERKAESMTLLKEQYDIAVHQKQKRIVKDIERDIAYAEKDLKIEKLRSKLIQEEAESLIAYYSELSEISEMRHRKIIEHNKHLKLQSTSLKLQEKTKEAPPVTIEDIKIEITPESTNIINLDERKPVSKSASQETFITAMETSDSECVTSEEIALTDLHSSKSMDILNANIEEEKQNEEVNENFWIAQENFKAALRNKAKVMSLELGFEITKNIVPKARTKYGLHDNGFLTEAQKNKMRVMSSEFGIEIGGDLLRNNTLDETQKTQMQMNKEKMMTSNECFYNRICDNVNFLNQNVAAGEKIDTTKTNVCLKIPIMPQTANFNNKQEATPMSIDSTPLSDVPSTPSTSKFLVQNEPPATATTNFTDDGFDFTTIDKKLEYIPCFTEKTSSISAVSHKSKRVSVEEAENVRTNCLHLFLQQSVSIPLAVQTKLINQELLKFFVNDLQYLKHLISLRNYFFLQDGEFGRNITEGLFEKLYDVNFPIELINCRTLQFLVHKALNSSSKCQENSDCLSFKINNLPKRFDLGDLNVLDCLSLSYKIPWPLNILLPIDTLAKYDEVFKHLLKLNRVSWVQKKIFEELKILSKEVGRNHIYLMSSPQYRKIHQCRHIMSHFIQTFQNYIVGDVLQCNWEIFNRNLTNVTDLDQLYSVHTTYIKNILFMCLLNHKAAPIRKVLEKIFIVILKFYDYLRSQSWTVEDGHYVHPNFNKLENIFLNFEEFVMYMFKVGRKIVKTGYQPYLVQLLDMLDINGYYDQRNNAVSSC